MFSLLDRIKFTLLFVFIIFIIQSSSSSSLENDKLAQLIERLDGMQIKIDAIQSKMELENDKCTAKIGDLEAEVEKLKTQKLQQDEEFVQLKNQLSHPKFYFSPPKWDDGPSPRLLSSPPTSCQELKNNNGLWPMDGIHLLKKNNAIQAAFCTFAADGSPVSETMIGRVDVKTKMVHFYVQRNSSFGSNVVVIPFELARLNEGNAFNLPSGVFTAPLKGIYNFQFSAVKHPDYNFCSIILQLNGVNVGVASTNQPSSGSYDTVSLSASLRLAVGDRVNLLNVLGVFYDDAVTHRTHFSGWLVEEELL